MFSNCDSKILDSFVGGVRLWKILCLSVNLCLAYQNNLLQAGRQAGKQAGTYHHHQHLDLVPQLSRFSLDGIACIRTVHYCHKKKSCSSEILLEVMSSGGGRVCVLCVLCAKIFSLSLSLSLFLSVVVVRRRPTQILFFFFSFRFLELSGHSFKIPTQKDAKLPPVYHTYIKSIMQWSTASKIDQPMTFRYMIRRTLIEDTIVQFFEEDIVAFNTINIYINIFTI